MKEEEHPYYISHMNILLTHSLTLKEAEHPYVPFPYAHLSHTLTDALTHERRRNTKRL